MKASAAALFLALTARAWADSDPSIVDTSSGTLKGVVGDDGGRMFAGVPFAQPPIGDLRWKAPVAEVGT